MRPWPQSPPVAGHLKSAFGVPRSSPCVVGIAWTPASALRPMAAHSAIDRGMQRLQSCGAALGWMAYEEVAWEVMWDIGGLKCVF